MTSPMTPKKPSEGKLLYHITKTDNMQSILENGLLPRADIEKNGYSFSDIADHNILADREKHKSPLSQYVPFHFYTKTPFDGDVCQRYGAKNMTIIAIKRDMYKTDNFSIIPTHPLHQNSPEIFPYKDGFGKIQWSILDDRDNRDYSNPEIKNACMAECLVPHRVDPSDFFTVFVPDEETKNRILNMNYSDKIRDKILVNPKMFPRL